MTFRGSIRAKWSDGQLFNKIKVSLDSRKQKQNNTQDALIAEVAIVQGFTLVTSDTDLARIASEYGANVLWLPKRSGRF